MSQITGAEIVFKAFADHGVEYIFGYPGGAILPLYDELRNHKKIKHILVRHEQGAGHAAEDAYVEMCPPTPTPGRCARCTIIAAFQRFIARILRSIPSSPGKAGSCSGEIAVSYTHLTLPTKRIV